MFNATPVAIAFMIGPVAVHWYGIFLVAALVAALLVLRPAWRRLNLPADGLADLLLVMVVGGVIGARLYYVIYAWPYYLEHLNETWQPWRGGLAIHGAWVGGLIVGWLWARRQAWPWWKILDQLVVALPLGQAIGRWGNYFNQELFGRPTNLPWGIPIDLANRPAGWELFTRFHPTFLYESLLDLILFGWLWSRRSGARPVGEQTAFYLLGYSLIRFVMEFWRVDYSPAIAGVRWAQIFSGLIIILAGGWLLRRPVRRLLLFVTKDKS